VVFIVVISIILASPHLSSSSFVFTHFENRTGFNPKSTFQNYYVSFLGLLTSLYAFAGYEGAATLAEETKDPHVNAPKGVFLTAVISFVVGLITILAILYGC
jgi:amino acid transporter